MPRAGKSPWGWSCLTAMSAPLTSGQGRPVEAHRFQAVLHQGTDIGVFAAGRIIQHPLIMLGKAMQGLLGIQPEILSHRQQAAGALVLLRAVVQRPVVKAAGLVVVMLLDERQGVGEAMLGSIQQASNGGEERIYMFPRGAYQATHSGPGSA